LTSLDTARRVLQVEAETIQALSRGLGDEFDKAVALLLACEGKVVFTGMGKSGLVCRKIAATFSSTGTPAFFLHPAEGVHGDLGILARGDLLVAVSNSGETEELVEILPLIRRLDLSLVAITGNPRSTLARRADVALFLRVEREACPLNLAPMTSTTATLALGDALAAAVMERKGFSASDFARFHPAGTLGRQLTLQVQDLMHGGSSVPRVALDTTLSEAILEMTSKRLGLTAVVDADDTLRGVITDGDLRRGLEKRLDLAGALAQDVMTENPKRVARSALAVEALRLMESHSITALFVVEDGAPSRIAGVVHIHDLVKAGLR